jgi:uncharacterized protein (TIGR02466 family)
MQISNLFATPVATFFINRDFTKSELSHIKELEKETNYYNEKSKNSYVLKEETLQDIEKFITTCINKVYTDVYNGLPDASLYITQSWVNYTKHQHQHHKHRHTNSILSGVLYIETDPKTDLILFSTPILSSYSFKIKEANPYNAETMANMVAPGQLLIFPSSLVHEVPPVESKKERISLSFNTFIRGDLGEDQNLTSLNLK